MLTDAALKHLNPRDKPYKVADRDGMYVRVSTNGTISFRYDYRINGRRETVTFGKYGATGLSLARARAKCIDARRMIQDGLSPSAAPTLMSGTVLPLCSPPSMWQPALLLANVTSATGPVSSSTSSIGSMAMSPQDSTSISSWTITPPTKPRRSRRGWRADRITTSTSRQLRRLGSIRWSDGSPNSPVSSYSAAYIGQSPSSKPISKPSSNNTIKIQSHSNGPNPPMTSWQP
jgi:hypothetical protein